MVDLLSECIDSVSKQVHILRVPTCQNIADLPSRPSEANEAFMLKVGARKAVPVLPECYMRADTWQVLVERWHAHGL